MCIFVREVPKIFTQAKNERVLAVKLDKQHDELPLN